MSDMHKSRSPFEWPLKSISQPQLIFIITLLGLLVSGWRIHIEDLVNTDGAAYLLAASGDWSRAATFKNWNFYPLFIGWVSGATSLTPEAIAHLCGALFDAVTLVFFLRVVALFGGDRLTVLWAGIAFLSLVYFNDNRAEVIRDHGYWAAYMVGVWYFIHLYREFGWPATLGWTLSMLVSSLFRVEGMVFLLLAPIALLGNTTISWPIRLRSLFKTWAPIMIIAVAVFFAFGVIGGFQDRLMELAGSLGRMYHEVTIVLPEKSEALREYVFPSHKEEEAIQGIYAVLAWGIFSDFIKGLSALFVLILVSRRWFPRPGMSPDSARIMWAFVLINLAIITSWMLIHQIMVARYVLGLVFIVLIWVVFALAQLHRRYSMSSKGDTIRSVFLAVSAVLVIMFVDGVSETGAGKAYIVDAGNWIKGTVPKESRIGATYESQRLHYYANKGLPEQPTFMVEAALAGRQSGLDYYFVRLRKGEVIGISDTDGLERDMTLLKKFVNRKGSGVAVYGR